MRFSFYFLYFVARILKLKMNLFYLNVKTPMIEEYKFINSQQKEFIIW